jgi:nucleotide-binding universal stress UspA family protein
MLTLSTILVPVDFSPCSKAALQYAVQIAERLDAAVEVLHVWEPPVCLGLDSGEVLFQLTTNDGLPLSELIRTHARKELDRLIAETQSRSSVKLSGRLEVGNIGDTVAEIAKTDQYDLVVMGTHGRRGLSRVLMGSIAEKVVRHANCPVITYRAPGNGQEKQVSAELQE